MGCSSLQTLFYCLTFNKGDEENVRSYFSRMKYFLGTGHYLWPGGGRSIFVVTSEHLPDPPVEYLVF